MNYEHYGIFFQWRGTEEKRLFTLLALQ